MDIYYSPKFIKEYKKLATRIKDLVAEKEEIFKRDPSDNRLKTHKLSGKWSDFWAFSVNYQYRVIFEWVSTNIIWFHSVGTHAVYK